MSNFSTLREVPVNKVHGGFIEILDAVTYDERIINNGWVENIRFTKGKMMKALLSALLLLGGVSAYADECSEVFNPYAKYAQERWLQSEGDKKTSVSVFVSDDSVKVRVGIETYAIGTYGYHGKLQENAGGRSGEKEFAPLAWTPLVRLGEAMEAPFVALADNRCSADRYKCLNKDYDSLAFYSKKDQPKFYKKMGNKVLENISKIEITPENELLVKCAENKAIELLAE